MKYLYILFIFFLFAQTTFVEAIPGLSELNDVVLITEPVHPRPGSTITASLQSFSHNLQGMNIKWSVDGTILHQGLGLTTVSIEAPSLGETIRLSAEVSNLTTVDRTITPIIIDILWEATTYTHKEYLGRALPVDGSRIRAMVIPHFGNSGIDDTKLIYNWYKDGRFLIKDSGINRNVIETESPRIFSRYNLNVEITDLQGIPLGRSGVTISSVEPELILYRSLPLIGTTFHKSLSNSSSTTITKENNIVAVPYYFSILNPNVLRYKWQSNNMKLAQNPGSEPQLITILESVIGSTLSVSARHRDILLQSARTNHSVIRDRLLDNHNDGQGVRTSPFGSPDSI